MKKATSFILLLFLSATAFAQFDLGVRAGLNFTDLKTDAGSLKSIYNESSDTRTGYSFGAYARIGRNVYIQPEVNLVTRNAKINLSSNPVDVRFTNFDVPVLVGWRPVKRFRVYAGPVWSLNIKEDEKIKDAFNQYISAGDEVLKNATYGYQLGFGTKLLGFEIDLRKEGGLTDLTFIKNQDFTQRTNGWQLSVGFNIL